jgi:hypothetical protein
MQRYMLVWDGDGVRITRLVFTESGEWREGASDTNFRIPAVSIGDLLEALYVTQAEWIDQGEKPTPSISSFSALIGALPADTDHGPH